jgi:ceramide glucosyltransferase
MIAALQLSRVPEILIWALLGAGWVYWIVAWRTLARFARARKPVNDEFHPPVSILKPVKGIDIDAMTNFASYCRQHYPQFEILFGVADTDDPAVGVVRNLQRRFPDVPIRLIVARSIGSNPKCGILHTLSQRARYDVLVLSDSDIRVEPDYLRSVVAPLADEKTGVVTCIYRSEGTRGIMAKLTELGLNVFFIPSAIVASQLLGISLGIGATLALRRRELEAIGGFLGIADYLADDHQVAARIARRGFRVHLSNYLVTNVLGSPPVRAQWEREVRWARNIRSLYPLGYLGLPMTHTFALCLLLLVLAGPTGAVLTACAVSVVLRSVAALRIVSLLHCDRDPRQLFLEPLRDLVSFFIWCWSARGRSVVWRGNRYRIGAGNRLAWAGPSQRLSRRVAATLVVWLDRSLRRLQHIQEFSQTPDCLLRIAFGPARRAVELADGTRIARGDRVGEVHYWNEHVSTMARGLPPLRWIACLRRQLLGSFNDLARRTESDPAWADVRAFHGVLPFEVQRHRRSLTRVVERVGAELRTVPGDGPLARLRSRGEALLARMLTLAFNPAAARPRDSHARMEFWISRDTLLSRIPGPIAAGTGKKTSPAADAVPVARRRQERTKRRGQNAVPFWLKHHGPVDIHNRLDGAGGALDLAGFDPVPQLSERRSQPPCDALARSDDGAPRDNHYSRAE